MRRACILTGALSSIGARSGRLSTLHSRIVYEPSAYPSCCPRSPPSETPPILLWRFRHSAEGEARQCTRAGGGVTALQCELLHVLQRESSLIPSIVREV